MDVDVEETVDDDAPEKVVAGDDTAGDQKCEQDGAIVEVGSHD